MCITSVCAPEYFQPSKSGTQAGVGIGTVGCSTIVACTASSFTLKGSHQHDMMYEIQRFGQWGIGPALPI